MKIRILRVVNRGNLISADIFEENFNKISSDNLIIDFVGFEEVKSILLSKDLDKINSFFSDFEYFSPGFEAFLLAPLFLRLRACHNLKTNLLFIAHAGGKHILEFYLFKKHIKESDLIITPSNNAKKVVRFLFPYLAKNTVTINHPIDLGYKPDENMRDNIIVSFARIDPEKLIHRVIEAIHILDKKGVDVNFFIAGSPSLSTSENDTTFARKLKAKIKRLNLEDKVRFLGEIRDNKGKFEILSKAKALINLSVTPEETFGKAVVESLNAGTPVLVTKWDGFTETGKGCGEFVDVCIENGLSDVNSHDISLKIEKLLLNHESYRELCLKNSKKYKPERISKKYHGILRENIAKKQENTQDRKDSFRKGYADNISILNGFTYDEIFDFYLDLLNKSTDSHSGIFYDILMASAQKGLKYLLSGRDFKEQKFLIKGEQQGFSGRGFYHKILDSIYYSSYQHTKEICILTCIGKLDLSVVEKAFKKLKEIGKDSFGLKYIEVEIEIEKGDFDNALRLWEEYFYKEQYIETDYLKLRQLAKICLKSWNFNKAKDVLEKWLVKFPDSPYSLFLWCDLCYGALKAGSEHVKTAEESIKKIEEFSENDEIVNKLRFELIKIKTGL